MKTTLSRFSLSSSALAYQNNDNLTVMNFLNEVAERFPQAITFASGRPSESLFDINAWIQELHRFAAYFAEREGISLEKAYALLGQYGRTNGIITDLIANMLRNDEGMEVSPDAILMTYGAQEAMELCLTTLCHPERDVVLVLEPTYIGMTGLATIKNIQLAVVHADAEGPDLAHLQQVIADVRAQGKIPRLFYVIPDFDNPTGNSMSLSRRRDLLAVSQQEGLLLVEDNPYGMFQYDDHKIPTLKALDTCGNVLYIGSFSKTLCPGLRTGFLVADFELDVNGEKQPIIDTLSQVKSLITVNTGQVGQAIVGGALLAADCSLKQSLQPLIYEYKTNRDCMLACLQAEMAAPELSHLNIRWNQPAGGFFIHIELPFEFGSDEVYECADAFGVICVPMAFFSLSSRFNHCIRLSFSYVTPEKIKQGVAALARYLKVLAARNAQTLAQ